jgi:hypothetical protein
MIFKPTKQFKKSFKALYKKIPSLSSDYRKFEAAFSENPKLGTDLGGGFRKVRISVQSKNKGKSGGARIITYEMCVKQQENIIILIDIYDKNEKETISEKEYTDILKRFLLSEF